MITFHATADLKKLREPLIIVGLPGTGLVGSVAASHLIDALKMRFCGYISSPEFAPLAAIHNYTPMPAARIHYSSKHNLVVILSEMSIPVSLSSELANKIFDFAQELNASGIISLGGISIEGGKKVYVVSSDKRIIRDVRPYAQPIREGATTGVTAILLTKGTLEKFPITTLLAESAEEYLDPGAAARVLKTLSKIIGVPIPTVKLEKEAKEVAERAGKGRVRRGVGESGSMYG